MLHRSINGIFTILAAVLVLTAGGVVYAQSSDAAPGKVSGSTAGAGKIGGSGAVPMSPFARPNIGSPDGGFSRQRPPSMVDIPKRVPSPGSTTRSNFPPGPIPLVVPPQAKAGREPFKAPPDMGPDPYKSVAAPRSNFPPGPIPLVVPPEAKKAKEPERLPSGCVDCPEPVPSAASVTTVSPGPIPSIASPLPPKKAPERMPSGCVDCYEPVPNSTSVTNLPKKEPEQRPSGCVDCYEPVPTAASVTTTYPPGPIPLIVPDPERRPVKEPVKKQPRPTPGPGPIPLIVPPDERPAATTMRVVVTDKYAPTK